MHIEGGLFADIVIIFVVAFLGGLAARLLRFPILLGYLAVGMVIGPHALEVVGDVETVQALAEFGVILLLFAVGIEVSFRDLRAMGKSVILVAVAQILGTIGIAYLIGLGLGWSSEKAVVFGMIASLSSTMVVLKTLSDRGELLSVHGKVLTGILLIQDLAFIPMIAVLPALSGEVGRSVLADLGFGILKATVTLSLMALLGGKAIPWLLGRVAFLGSREVFIMAVVSITFAIAALTQVVGLSAALGAFVAGLLLSESDFGHRALSEIVPLRDTFSALFFVSLGMLVDYNFLVENYLLVLAVIGVVIVIKFILVIGLTRAFRYLTYTAVLSGLGMVQVGEFSFILADSGASMGVIDQDFLTLVVVAAVLTMALTPWIIAGGAKAVERIGSWSMMPSLRIPGNGLSDRGMAELRDHVVVCGMGRVGTLIAESLQNHRVPFIVIDMDPYTITRSRDHGYYAVHGSSTSETVLEAAGVGAARLLVISTGAPATAWVTAQHALRMNPGLDIVARVHWREEGERLQRLGVQEVVWPEMEAGLEILRHSLLRYNADHNHVEMLVEQLREHLSFDTDSEADDVLPPEGLGSDPEARG